MISTSVPVIHSRLVVGVCVLMISTSVPVIQSRLVVGVCI